MTFTLENNTKKSIGVLVAFVMGFMLLIASMSFTPKVHTSMNTSQSAVEFKDVELNLAQVIYKHGKKNKKNPMTWNESQTKASKIVNMVLTGSDIASAISIVLGFLSFGLLTAITWAARMTLKWYIKKQGKKKAVTW